MKNPKATLRVLGSILGLLVGGFVGGAIGLALGLSAARHSPPSPMGSPGAGLVVVMTLPVGALLGAAAGLVAWRKIQDGPVGRFSDAELPRRVSIDYGVDLEDVVRQEPLRFTAIRPIGPCVEYRTSGWIEGLQHTIRNSLRASNEAPPYSPSTLKKKLGTTKKAGTTKRGTAPTALPPPSRLMEISP